jgi:alpha-mannosidase
VARIALDGKVTGLFADYHYVGTGDVGGGPSPSTVKMLEALASKGTVILPPPDPRNGPYSASFAPSTQPQRVGEGPVHVVASTADQMFKDIPPAMIPGLPEYRGDLELINHSAGSLTSQAYHKHWVLRNEVLADAAEKASVAAAWLGGRAYPQQRLNAAWMLALGGHFHDTAAGTATPRAYQYAWNDDVIVGNQFAGIATDASAVIASALDTQVEGLPVVIYNTLNIARTDVVEAHVGFAERAPHGVRVLDPQGNAVPAELDGQTVRFLATAPAVGYAVFTIQPAGAVPGTHAGALSVTKGSLENRRYRVKLDANGDVSSVIDKSRNRELLAAPIRLAISNDTPRQWPAWNMDFDQEQAEPRTFVGGPVDVQISEDSEVRVALTVTRSNESSKFVQRISLAAGDAGNRVEFANSIEWRDLAANLKVVFPLSASNPNATYNWDVGTVQRPTAAPRQFEVASHRWIDLTDASGTFGATILTGDKNGSDKRDDHTLRLTLLRSPGIRTGADGRPGAYSDQANQDWGHHEITFALAGHAGDWRAGQTDWQAYRLSNPLIVFTTSKHPGALGKSFSLLHVDNPRVRVLALKKAETSDEIVLRLVELDGRSGSAHISFAARVTGFREVDAQERPLASMAGPPAGLNNGILAVGFTPYQPRTFALRLAAAAVQVAPGHSEPVKLSYDVAVASNDDTEVAGPGFDGRGNALPAEMLPAMIDFQGVQFALPVAATGKPNAIAAHGQTIRLPAGDYNRIVLLAASAEGDRDAVFQLGDRAVPLHIEDWGGFIGQWDTRQWKNVTERDWATSANHAPWPPADMPARESYHSPEFPKDYTGLQPGFIKLANVAWFASHHHTAAGLNQPYQYAYLFAYTIERTPGADTLTLPNDDRVRILAISVGTDAPMLTPGHSLFDTLGRTEPPQL